METALISIVTLLLGWVLANAADHVKAHRIARAGFRKAIADLLEIRHQLLGYQATVREIKKVIPVALPATAEIQIRTLVLRTTGIDAPLVERFSKSVDTIAEFDPILAFRLRGKDQIQRFLSLMHQAGADPLGADVALEVERSLMEYVIPALEEVMVEASREMDRRLAKRLEQRFERRDEVEPVLGKLMELVRARIDLQLRAPLAPNKAPEPTTTSGTSAAEQPLVPAAVVAHL